MLQPSPKPGGQLPKCSVACDSTQGPTVSEQLTGERDYTTPTCDTASVAYPVASLHKSFLGNATRRAMSHAQG